MPAKTTHPNRREALKMLGSVFAGSTIMGLGTYNALKNYQTTIALDEAKEMHGEAKYASIPIRELEQLAIKTHVLTDYNVAVSSVGAALGGFVGSVYYDWDLPSLTRE